MAAPIANVNQAIVVHGYAVQYRHKRVTSLGLRALQIPLAQELSGAIKHGNAMVATGSFAVSHVDIAVLGIDRHARGFEERLVAGIQSFSFGRSIGRIDYAAFSDLEQQFASLVRIFLYNAVARAGQ